MICEKILDVKTWSSFDGHGLLPGIDKAEYENRTTELVGSRIRVKNSDGTQHLEEILEWEAGKKLIMKIHEFPIKFKFYCHAFYRRVEFQRVSKKTKRSLPEISNFIRRVF